MSAAKTKTPKCPSQRWTCTVYPASKGIGMWKVIAMVGERPNRLVQHIEPLTVSEVEAFDADARWQRLR